MTQSSSESFSRSIASGLAAGGAAGASVGGRLPPSGPVLAATNPTGARAWRSKRDMASVRLSSPSWLASTTSCACAESCWLREMAWEAMKLTSVLKSLLVHDLTRGGIKKKKVGRGDFCGVAGGLT